MSSVVQFASQESNSTREDGNERFDLLRLPRPAVTNLSLPAEAFLKAAVSIKDQVVEVTWKRRCEAEGTCTDPTAYTGLLGTAFTCLRSYLATGSRQDLLLCADIVDACASVARTSYTRHLTFLCGKGGVCALGAVVANLKGDYQKRDLFLDLFFEIAQERALPVGPEEGGFGMSYDLLYGRAGFLWAALFINKHLGQGTVPNDLVMPVVEAVFAGGRAGASDNTGSPLMFRWHGTRYWGAAHGLAGILHVLLHFPLSKEDAEDVKRTLHYMMSNRFPSGNYPSSEGNPRDKLVQWSHGATAMAITLGKASQVFLGDREFREAAIEAGEVVWKNGLVKKVGLSDGVAGNAYALLSLRRLTGEGIYEERAKAFGSFLYHTVTRELVVSPGQSKGADYSLFQGLAGAACLWFDLLEPANSKFPGYEL
ncbi:lanC-like protein GCL1 [Diospyros lotus]|uniref:lanC-like protein GCL1 n=1 Tax=Diospyros lotus TaxID=55363 RepID=UPI00225647C3|nr:lanC-like protein GCL1 [Diospyros lotus]